MTAHRLEVRAATATERAAAETCLSEHAREAGAAVPKFEPFSVLALCDDAVVGGVIGQVFWKWLYAKLVWVEKPFRGTGIGKAVMQKAEERARELGLTGIYLWTQSWQAPDFYRKLGFESFVVFENFPRGRKRLGFRKYL
ncbi:MAG TPA: GNAT family N-acetyltransferase [Stellaceae bacterium]|nr:GNAT family N-acetyltransferase [Stellaceae bacterium]